MGRILASGVVAGVAVALAVGAGAGGCSNYGGVTYGDGGMIAIVPNNGCSRNDQCGAGTYCGPGTLNGRTCVAAGTGTSGATCTSDAQCASGLRCDLVGLSAECQPEGKNDIGSSCTTSTDCLGGLGCTGGTCQAYPPGSATVPLAFPPIWPGETCMDVPTPPTRAYFHVPRGTNDGDFYRLPFPNDVRLNNGKVSLSNPNHPTPGKDLLGYDLVKRWLTDLENTVDGFSTYPTVYFRFNAGVDIGGTLKAAGAVQFVDITDPMNPVSLGFNWVATTDRNSYICNNWMGVRPQFGVPLKPGHTYTVFIASSAKDSNGQAITPSDDLVKLLGAQPPTDPVLAMQWPKYQPLRTALTATLPPPSPPGVLAISVPGGSILNATVFTVGHPNAIGPKLAAAVAAATAPTASGWVRCGDGQPDPCPQASGPRACPASPDPTFDELHALVTLPIFQTGTEPYTNPPDGDFMLDSMGNPQVQRTEQVCMALTVPKGATPGVPVVLYAHGTGGSFRSHVSEGVAARLANVDGTTHIAVLGIDQVETGPRRGASMDSPDNLFYNFANPGAARGNPLQGAADQLSLLRFIAGFDLMAAASPTNAEIKFGPVAFWGHSQGATEGGIAMPYATGVLGAVLSGEGASLMDALINKTNPVNIAAALPVALEDPKVDINHPVLSLLQGDLGLVDPLNHAMALVKAPIAAANQKHIFQPFGQGDTYAPPATEETFALAAMLTEAAPPAGVTDMPMWMNSPPPVPVGGNAMVTPPGGMNMAITAIVRQYAPDATYDGHFVAFKNMAAEADVDHFLADALARKTPMVGR
jgi:hypothetical protein